MANTTFNGPVRSEGGFKQVTKSATLGTFTENFSVDSSGNLTTTWYGDEYVRIEVYPSVSFLDPKLKRTHTLIQLYQTLNKK